MTQQPLTPTQPLPQFGRYVLCSDDRHGDPVILTDSESDRPEVYHSPQEALAEAAELNLQTLGGYYVCRLLAGGCLERVNGQGHST